MRLGKLETLDDEAVKDLDREVAEQFCLQNKSNSVFYYFTVQIPEKRKQAVQPE